MAGNQVVAGRADNLAAFAQPHSRQNSATRSNGSFQTHFSRKIAKIHIFKLNQTISGAAKKGGAEALPLNDTTTEKPAYS